MILYNIETTILRSVALDFDGFDFTGFRISKVKMHSVIFE